MRFGYFDDEQREYVITRPDTPLPWINYLGSKAYFGLISNTAGGYSFYKDARLRRLTRYRYNHVPTGEGGGRYLYLRDDAAGEFWSPSWQPVCKPIENYTCRHGLGYTIISSTCREIETRTRYFVPPEENLEVWDVSITNHRSQAADLSLFSSVEFCLWDAQDDATNFQRNFNTGEVEVVEGVIYHKTEYRERRDHYAYFACSAPLAGFETQREDFLGPYRGWEAPRAVETGVCANSIAHGWSPIGVHHVRLEQMLPGETRRVIFILGYHENPRDDKFDPPGSQIVNKRAVQELLGEFLTPENIDAAFDSLRRYWDGLLSVFQVETPNQHANRMINIWNAYQTMITFNLSRSASYYESGIGRGMGFRDSNQDLLGFVHMAPARGRQRLLDLAATQLETGGAYHQYQPLTRRGNNDVGGNFNDDPLWLVIAVTSYIKETGDFSILDEQVPYDNRPGSEQPLYEHLQRSLCYTLDRRGPHGLPLIGRADWNDCLNLNCFSTEPGQSFQTTTNKDGKVAESVFIAGLFILAATEMADLCDHTGNTMEADEYRRAAAEFDRLLHTCGWDGAWFRRAYDDFGEPVGSAQCDEGQIYIEPQGMCVMAGVGLQDGLAQKALNSVAARLATPHGIVLHQPAYTYYREELGEISSYPPGYKENAGIFCHTNPWVMIAETRLGRGNQAFDYYLRINPSAREEQSEVHRCEPYVYAQMIAGKDAPTHGEAKNSWLTGTAAWNLVAVTQHILGIRPTLDGLQVSPVIPDVWPGFTAVRIWRGVRYHIRVQRAGSGNQVKLSANGRDLPGSIVPLPPPDVSEVFIEVKLGASPD